MRISVEQGEVGDLHGLSPSNLTGNSPSDDNVERQTDAPDDLKVVSWNEGQSLEDMEYFAYKSNLIFRPTIYVIDTGLETSNLVSTFTYLPSQYIDSNCAQDFGSDIDNWVFSPKVIRRGLNTKSDAVENSHGTCVASKAAGRINGVCKVCPSSPPFSNLTAPLTSSFLVLSSQNFSSSAQLTLVSNML